MRVYRHIFKDIENLAQVGKQFLHARIAALHLPSLKIAQSPHALGNWQARAVSARLESQPCEKGRFRIAPGL